MVVNFRVRGISRGACKLTRTPMLIKKKKEIDPFFMTAVFDIVFRKRF